MSFILSIPNFIFSGDLLSVNYSVIFKNLVKVHDCLPFTNGQFYFFLTLAFIVALFLFFICERAFFKSKESSEVELF